MQAQLHTTLNHSSDDTMKTKSIFSSKTVLLQVLTAPAALHPATREFAATHLAEVGVAVAALNVLLRWITKDKVTLF